MKRRHFLRLLAAAAPTATVMAFMNWRDPVDPTTIKVDPLDETYREAFATGEHMIVTHVDTAHGTITVRRPAALSVDGITVLESSPSPLTALVNRSSPEVVRCDWRGMKLTKL